MPSPPSTPRPAGHANSLAREDTGYHHDLGNRQLQMIAIGGAIGTGLFLGAGGRLASAGPALFLVYAFCGVFVFFILRALGELVLHRPASGSFVSYAREFFGEKAAFVAGWMYFLNWAMTGIVDSTAIAKYFHYWRVFQVVPQWALALIALVAVVTVNMISVKAFGELEFWAALIKVLALITFLIIGTVFLAASPSTVSRPDSACGPTTAGFSLPVCCPSCWSPRGWCSPTPPSNWSAPLPERPRSRRRSCRVPSIQWWRVSRFSTSARWSCWRCCCLTPPTKETRARS
jgi:amino acid transporter